MKVISVPFRLRVVTFLLLLCVPLVALEVILHFRAPWWNLPERSIQAWGLGFTLVLLPLVYWISQGKRAAVYFVMVLGVVWCLASFWLAIVTKNFWLGLFDLFLTLYWVLIWSWVRLEFGRSFFDPRVEWYQSLPRPIGLLKCRLIQANGRKYDEEYRVSRLDQDGAFIFFDRTDDPEKKAEAISDVRRKDKIQMEFFFKGHNVRCVGKPIRVLDRNEGLGLMFAEAGPDSRKRLGDFVENLRGEGYVS